MSDLAHFDVLAAAAEWTAGCGKVSREQGMVSQRRAGVGHQRVVSGRGRASRIFRRTGSGVRERRTTVRGLAWLDRHGSTLRAGEGRLVYRKVRGLPWAH